jgi:hypothetical protein
MTLAEVKSSNGLLIGLWLLESYSERWGITQNHLAQIQVGFSSTLPPVSCQPQFMEPDRPLRVQEDGAKKRQSCWKGSPAIL